jgi:hypothetical protein
MRMQELKKVVSIMAITMAESYGQQTVTGQKPVNHVKTLERKRRKRNKRRKMYGK